MPETMWKLMIYAATDRKEQIRYFDSDIDDYRKLRKKDFTYLSPPSLLQQTSNSLNRKPSERTLKTYDRMLGCLPPQYMPSSKDVEE